jgi:hypothetical protein
MSIYYFDASALAKRYTRESGSEWTTGITNATANQIVLLSEITLAEVAAVLAAKHRAPQGITKKELEHALSRFLAECDQEYLLLQVDRSVIDLAVELTQRHRLRGYDAVQLATAWLGNQDLITGHYPPLTFIAADNDLLHAARAEGLDVDNPLEHTTGMP